MKRYKIDVDESGITVGPGGTVRDISFGARYIDEIPPFDEL